MRALKSFRFRILISLWGFGLLLVVLYTAMAILLLMLPSNVSRQVFAELQYELDHFNQAYERDKNTPLPQSRLYASYADLTHLPEETRKRVAAFDNGFHKFAQNKGENSNKDYYLAVAPHPDNISKIYMLYDYDLYADEFKANFKNRAFRRFSLAFYMIVVLALFVGLVTSKKIIAPLNKLTSLIKASDPENLPKDLSKGFPENEVGFLAVSLENAMQRIREFVEREKNFTRDASHELRTPVTIIKGAVELLRQKPESNHKQIDRLLQRVERSLKNMEITIETFLWLGREQQTQEKDQTANLKRVVENTVEENQYLLSGKTVSLKIDVADNAIITAPEPVLKIAVVNLVRNAFSYTPAGKISICATQHYFEITDTGIGVDADDLENITHAHIKSAQSQGFGLGLAIVDRLCKRFNWTLDIGSESQSGTQVRVIFRMPEI